MAERAGTKRNSALDPVNHGSSGRGRLNEATIVAAALEVTAEVGVEGLTMRVLSDRLGVALGATYKHVPNKQDLMVKVANDLFARIEDSMPDSGDWAGRLHQQFQQIYEVFSSYPGLAEYVSSHSVGEQRRPPSMQSTMVSLLSDAGFATSAVDDVMKALFCFTTGALLVDMHSLSADPAGTFSAGLDLLLWGASQRLEHQRSEDRTRRATVPAAGNGRSSERR